MTAASAVRRLVVFAGILTTTIASAPRAQLADPSGWHVERATLAADARPRTDAIALVSGIAYRPDVQLLDGELRFVLAPPAGQFAGVAFRMASAADYEILYFRSSTDCGCWIDMQYQPVFQGETTWQLYNDSTYTAVVPRSHRRGDLAVRIALAGSRADVYLGADKRPVLRTRLVREPIAGGVGFWAIPDQYKQPAELRGLSIDANVRGSLAPLAPAFDRFSSTRLTGWLLSPRQPAPSIEPPATPPEFVASDTARWIPSQPDASGLIDLTKQLGNAAGPQPMNVFGGAGWGIAYAKLRLVSNHAQTRRLWFSYSDGIGVYVDGTRVYTGRNDYGSKSPDFLGALGPETEFVDLPLRAGPTDIVLAITDKAFGWGFRAHLDSMDGVTIVAPGP